MRTENDMLCEKEKACGRKGMPGGRKGDRATLCVVPKRTPGLRDTANTCLLTPWLSGAPKEAHTPEVEFSLQVDSDAWMAPLYK